MKTLRIFALLSLVAALSCRREPIPHVGPDKPSGSNVEVRATATLPEDWIPMTKAPGDITDIDNAGLQSKGFGLYAFYTGGEDYSAATDSSAYEKFGLVLNNRLFSYSAPDWENTGKAEFWPTTAGENLSLFAYAPWDTWHSVVEYDGKVPTIVYDDYVAQNLSAAELSKQRDLLWGTNTSGNPHRNVEKDEYSPEGTVDFHFRHAVAKVHLGVKGTLPGEVRNMTSAGRTTSSTGAAGDTESGETVSTVDTASPTVANNSNYYRSEGFDYSDWVYVRYYHAVQTQTETESIVQTRYRTMTETSTGAIYSVSGQRYLIEEVTLKGFNRKGRKADTGSADRYPCCRGTSRSAPDLLRISRIHSRSK